MAREHGLQTGVDCTKVSAIVPGANAHTLANPPPSVRARRDLQRAAAGSARSPRAIGMPFGSGSHGMA